MGRLFYIAVGTVGLLAVVGAAGAAAVLFVPPGRATEATLIELTVGAVGLVLAAAGLQMGRQAGEFDVAHYRRSDGPDGVPAGVRPEVAFSCPSCGRAYRAAGQCVGRPFDCRRCDARFTVPAEPPT